MHEIIADTELTVRAVNPDNKAELMQLIALISKALASSPGEHSAVQNPRFVRACLGSKFISLVACLESRPIAHLAYSVNQSERVQILLPLVDPDYLELSPAIEERFRITLMSEATRKGWSEFEVQHLSSPSALKLENLPLGLNNSSSIGQASQFRPMR